MYVFVYPYTNHLNINITFQICWALMYAMRLHYFIISMILKLGKHFEKA